MRSSKIIFHLFERKNNIIWRYSKIIFHLFERKNNIIWRYMAVYVLANPLKNK